MSIKIIKVCAIYCRIRNEDNKIHFIFSLYGVHYCPILKWGQVSNFFLYLYLKSIQYQFCDIQPRSESGYSWRSYSLRSPRATRHKLRTLYCLEKSFFCEIGIKTHWIILCYFASLGIYLLSTFNARQFMNGGFDW